LCGNLIIPNGESYVYFYAEINLRNLLYNIGPSSQPATFSLLSQSQAHPPQAARSPNHPESRFYMKRLFEKISQ